MLPLGVLQALRKTRVGTRAATGGMTAGGRAACLDLLRGRSLAGQPQPPSQRLLVRVRGPHCSSSSSSTARARKARLAGAGRAGQTLARSLLLLVRVRAPHCSSSTVKTMKALLVGAGPPGQSAPRSLLQLVRAQGPHSCSSSSSRQCQQRNRRHQQHRVLWVLGWECPQVLGRTPLVQRQDLLPLVLLLAYAHQKAQQQHQQQGRRVAALVRPHQCSRLSRRCSSPQSSSSSSCSRRRLLLPLLPPKAVQQTSPATRLPNVQAPAKAQQQQQRQGWLIAAWGLDRKCGLRIWVQHVHLSHSAGVVVGLSLASCHSHSLVVLPLQQQQPQGSQQEQRQELLAAASSSSSRCGGSGHPQRRCCS